MYRLVVRSGGRRNLRSEVVLQWLKWDDRSEQPIEVRSAVVRELSRGGIIVTATRIDQEEGRAVAKVSVANAVTGVAGEARVWPQASAATARSSSGRASASRPQSDPHGESQLDRPVGRVADVRRGGRR